MTTIKCSCIIKYMNDLKKTQHFSTNKDLLFGMNFNPIHAVDPFAGKCDLSNMFPYTMWELYDIDVKTPEVIYRDSLMNPIDYTGKTVITNPPYLAKNKTSEFKEIFEKYQTDDLYKAAILSIIGCKNGILIIPLNFFTDENSRKVREEFLSRYKVEYVNCFTKQMFKNTTYNVCSFYFEEGETKDVMFNNIFEQKIIVASLKEEEGYRLGGWFFEKIKKIKPIFSRSIGGKANTNIFVNCLDKRNKKFGLEYVPNYVYNGNKKDRIFATLNCEKDLTEEEQREIVNLFNFYVTNIRDTCGDLIFTNYRDFGRKRISFEDVYKICTMCYEEVTCSF